MHVDEERVQRLLCGELSEMDESEARDHLARCPQCRRRVDDARREGAEVNALLRHLDAATPQVGAREIAARARRRASAWLRWAAGIGFVLALGGAVYAGPLAMIRDWLATVVAPQLRTEGTETEPDRAPARGRGMEGIAVAPGDDFVILFTSAQSEGHVRVTLVDGAEVVVRAPSGVATYTSGAARLAIDNRTSGADFDVQLPRSAPRVEIRVAGGRLLLKRGPRVEAKAPAAVDETYILPLAP